MVPLRCLNAAGQGLPVIYLFYRALEDMLIGDHSDPLFLSYKFTTLPF